MLLKNKKLVFRGGVVVFLVLTVAAWNAPASMFDAPFVALRDAFRDRKVVDVLYLSEKAASEGDVVDKSFPSKVKAAVAANSARTFYGATNSVGRLMWATGASNSTGAEITGPIGTASNIGFVKAYHAPTRDEILAGAMKVDGSLAVSKIVGGQDAAGDASLEFDQTTVTSAQTCDALTFGSCWRAFDIAYEQLSGEAMVAFSTSTTGRLSYRTWNGTSWTPATTTTASSMVTGGSGAIRWVRLIPRGEGMKGTRSDEILMIASDANSDIFAGIWNGSAWTATTTITTTASTFQIQNFDGAWEETTGNALVVWSEGTSATTAPYRYKRWTRSNTTWDASGTSLPAVALSSIGHWVSVKSAPIAGKDHIAIIGSSASTIANNTCGTATNCRAQPYIWTGGASPTMTIGNQWASQEPLWQQTINVAVESLNAGVQAVYMSSTGGTTDASAWQTWIEGTGFSAITDMTGAMGDDFAAIQATAHPNSTDIFITGEDIDSDCNATYWNGSGIGVTWDTAACNSSGELALAPLNDTSQQGEGLAFWVAPVPYSPWSRNWRFYGDYTENDPDNTTDSLNVAENQTPTVTQEGFIRLRFQFAELAGLAQTDARKKLQWTTDDPDSLSAVWTDVGDTTETTAAWRYATAAETCANCSDDTAIGAQRLTGSTQSGTYLSDKDLAAGTNMDHAALALAEYDYPLKAENPSAGLTYYFRAYDNDQLTPVFREQDTDGSNDCSSAACAYPSATVAAPVITVSSAGTQTSPMNVSSVGNYLGGAFTFVRSAGTADITQIVVSETGTVNANADLINFRLWYETAGTCTYTGTSTLTAFNASGASFDGTDKATVTGTISVGTSQVCVYALVDVGSGATPTETIDIEITDPSTEVTVSAGTVTPASTIAITGTTTLQAASTVSCSTSVASTAFGALTTSAVATASPNASTTTSCSYAGGCTLSVQDAGNGASPGLATTTPAYLIPSANATLSAGTEGYGIQAATTAVGSGAVLNVNSIYEKIGNDVGGLTIANTTIASSSAAFTNREIIVTHKAAIGILTNAGSYTDTITYSCTGNP